MSLLGSAPDFSLDDLAANIVFRAVGVQRNPRQVEDREQLGPVIMRSLQQPVKHDKDGTLLAKGLTVKAQAQVNGTAGRGLAVALVAEKIAV